MMRQSGGDQMSRTLGALDQIADSSRGTPGRKNVIWVGAGYPSIDETGMSDRDAQALTDAIQLVMRRLMDSRVTLYTIDPGGPQVTAPAQTLAGDAGAISTGSALGPFDSGEVDFTHLAELTGGHVLFARNDVDREIAEQVEESGAYYTLSYVPTGDSDAAQSYRQIRVRTKDPALRAVTRDGYFADKGPIEKVETDARIKQPKQLSFDIRSAAMSRLAYNGLHLRTERLKDGFAIKVAARDLQWNERADGTRSAELTVFAIGFNARGSSLIERAAELTEQIGPQDALKEKSPVTLTFHMPVPPSAKRVRLVVRDAGTGAIGTADALP